MSVHREPPKASRPPVLSVPTPFGFPPSSSCVVKSQSGCSTIKGRKTKLACRIVFVLGELVPSRASWASPARNSTESTQSARPPACPPDPQNCLFLLKFFLHMQSQIVCGSWMRQCAGSEERTATGSVSLPFQGNREWEPMKETQE